MIKYNNSNINDWYFDASDIIKVYRNNAVCYYKITTSGGTSGQTPCYAVVDDISQYSETEFEDVFDKATDKWYKLNNLSQYEEYGVYGSGRNITYYEGKLTIDDGYEYAYSGSSWVNVGEVSGSTATLPNVPFTVNYNAKNYDSNTKTLLKTSGQLADVDAVITAGTPTVNDGYLTIAQGTRAKISGYGSYFNRKNKIGNLDLTIISKQRTDGGDCHIFANRDSNYNWMYRPYSTKLTLHGTSERGYLSVTTQPVIESARVYHESLTIYVKYNNYTDNTSSSANNFTYGNENSGDVALFAGYANNTGEWFEGDFYWIYMSQTTLTDEQIQQVINYNEGSGGTPTYPIYYDVIQDPPSSVTFSSMTEAEEYECPYVGLNADIDGTDYIFDENYDWVTKYGLVEVSGEYLCADGNKYKKMEEKVRNVDDTWSSQDPPVYEIGDLIESASTDCQQTFYTLYELEQTRTVSADTCNVKMSPIVSGITKIRLYVPYATTEGNCCFIDINSDDSPSTNFFAIKTDANGTLYRAVEGYTTIKSAANSSSCQWAYWVDADTMEIDISIFANTTARIHNHQVNFSKTFISFCFT